MENITSQMNGNNDQQRPNTPPAPGPQEVIQQMTGLNIDPDRLAPPETTPMPHDPAMVGQLNLMADDPNGVRKAEIPAPTHVPGSGSGIISADAAAAMGIDVNNAQAVNYDKMAREAEEARLNKQLQERRKNVENLFDEALAVEDQRLEKAVEITSDPEKYKEVVGEEQAAIAYTAFETDAQRYQRLSGNPTISEDDLLPAYDDDTAPEDEEKIQKEITDAAVKEILDMDVAEPIALEVHPVTRVKDPMVEVTLPDKEPKTKILGDQAFENAVARFKKDRFGKTTVPLVNSGFLCDVVGTGVIDLQNLYINLNRNVSRYEYEIEQMKTVIQSVTGTYPKVPSTQLKNMVHFADFQMMTFGHVCSTLKTVEASGNCTECGSPFRLTQEPMDLLLNADELQERRMQIEAAINPESISLLGHNTKVTTSVGIIVTLGHPTYAEMLRYTEAIRAYVKTISELEATNLNKLIEILYMVKVCKLPDGAQTNSIIQNYKALKLLTQEDLDLIIEESNKMRKKIIVPKFGIKKVVCPNCGHVNTDIPYDDLADMVFYHTTISSLMSSQTRTSEA